MARFEKLISASETRSGLLVILFILFYTVLVLSTAFVLVAAAIGAGWVAKTIRMASTDSMPDDPLGALWDIFFGTRVRIAASILGAYGVAILLVLAARASGPGIILSLCQARRIGGAEFQVLRDVAQEMSVAAGIPTPSLCVVESPSLNAFSVGYRNEAVVVVVATGLVERLTRDQLQAVMAHELARIRDGDIGIMTLVSGLGGPLVFGGKLYMEFGRWTTESPTGENWSALGWALLLLLPFVAPVLAASPIVGRLMQLSISRERVFMADAEAARLARYPEALASALEAMAADTEPVFAASRATAHLYVLAPLQGDGTRIGGDGTSAWSAHPPIEDRIARLRSIGNAEG
jgi:heat shock protein HtpX